MLTKAERDFLENNGKLLCIEPDADGWVAVEIEWEYSRRISNRLPTKGVTERLILFLAILAPVDEAIALCHTCARPDSATVRWFSPP